ncbi:MAG: HDOD domain-containing protein [Desulfobacteraceae bacterium]
MNFKRNHHIPAGTFKTLPKGDEVLQAQLGTCVGVTLYDKQAAVGGLAHFILPEPPYTGEVQDPEKYASTGLPLIIDKLVEQGASLERLEAVVAGGALMLPVTEQDINLDFGGRSADIVHNLLKRKGIRISGWETGGFFACTLELDMSEGRSRINPCPLPGETGKSQTGVYEPLMDHIEDTVDKIQPIPQIALKLLRMMEEPGRNTADIAEELGKDQVLSARTLKICNSALFTRRVKIDSLKDAILVLGESLLIRSVITAAVKEYYGQPEISGYSLCKGGLFYHAVGTALAAEQISSLTGVSTPAKAYTAGLLHDIGKVVIDQYLAKADPMFFRNAHSDKDDFLTRENKMIGTTHCHAGAYLAGKWSLPDSVTSVIKYHHHPAKAVNDKELVSTVFLADLFMSRYNTGLETEKVKTAQTGKALENLGLSFKDIEWLVDAMPRGIFHIASLVNPKDETADEEH